MKKYCKMSCKYRVLGYPNSPDYCEKFCGYLDYEIHSGCGFNIQFQSCTETPRPGPSELSANKSCFL